MKLRSLACAIAFGCTALLASHAHAGSGSFNILSYNVAETPTAYNGSSDAHSKVISCYIRQFNIVNVQEDFLWHAALYDTCDNHPYRTPTSGTAGIGDGLNTLSSFAFDDLDRVTWTNRADSDALTPKGSRWSASACPKASISTSIICTPSPAPRRPTSPTASPT
jgi:hypothetical protein